MIIISNKIEYFSNRCQLFRHPLVWLILLCFGASSYGENFRRPASYVPEDDYIFVPLKPKSLYETVIEYNPQNLNELKQQIRIWTRQDQEAERYGFKKGDYYKTVEYQNRIDRFQNLFTGYLRRQAREPLKQVSQEELAEFRQSFRDQQNDEIEINDTIYNDQDFMFEEGRASKEDSKAGKVTQSSREVQPSVIYRAAKAEKTVPFFNGETKLKFKPRIGQGALLVNFFNPVLDIHFFSAVNGAVRLRAEKYYPAIRLRVGGDYDNQSEVFTTRIDQELIENLTLRFSQRREPAAVLENFKDVKEVRVIWRIRF